MKQPKRWKGVMDLVGTYHFGLQSKLFYGDLPKWLLRHLHAGTLVRVTITPVRAARKGKKR